MKTISGIEEYLCERRELVARLALEKCLPEMLFADKYKTFRFADFYLALGSKFIKGLMEAGGKDGVVLYFLNPSAEDHFALSGKYAVLSFSLHDELQDVASVLNEPAGEGQGVSLVAYNYQFVYYARNGEWVVFCDRDFEVCILASVNHEVATKLCNALSMAYGGTEVCSTIDEFFSDPEYGLDEASKAVMSANYASADGTLERDNS